MPTIHITEKTAAPVGQGVYAAGQSYEVSQEEADRLSLLGVIETDADVVDATDEARDEARERGVDLATVDGTGEGGRILVGDVRSEA